MDPKEHQTSAEAELESFRQKWRAEVSARSKGKAPAASGSSANADVLSNKARPSRSNAPDATASTHEPRRSVEDVDQVMPHVYQGLGEKQHVRRLDETSAETAAALARNQEPTSALEHYEKAVEKESEGRLGDSLSLYRKAFKLDDTVDRIYKAKHFPPSYFKAQSKKIRDPSVPTSTAPAPAPKPPNLNPSNASATVPNTAHHSLHGLSATLANLITDFTTLSIQGEPPPTDLSPAPPCPIASVPEEIIVEILEQVAIRDVASFVRLAQVCKRLAYLVTTEDRVWKRLALGHEYGFAAMHYSWTCQVDGSPLGDGDDDEGGIILGTSTPPDFKANPTPPPLALTLLLVPSPYPTYRALFQRRPRIRFNGCYISTVNYTRAGQASPTSVTWNSPIHIVTYYRYIRFLRDGTCISLLSTSEPSDVVPYLYIEHMHKHHGALPSAPIKDALLGRWRLTGPEPRGDDDGDDDAEKEGNVVIEMAGVTPKYMYKMLLGLGTAGRGAKNNKLSWHGYWSYNRLTDDWGEFGLKNDRAFYWSRVRSYGMSWNEKGTKLGKSR